MKHALLVIALLFVASVASADNVSFTFDIINAPGGIGDMSWTIVAPGLNQSLDTESWYAASNPSNGGGCAISRIFLEAQGNGAYSLNTFFTPLCDGKYDSLTAGVDFTYLSGGAQYGTVNWWGTSPDGTINYETLTILPTNLAVTSPEPSTLALLLVALACIAWPLLRRRSTVGDV